MELSQMLAILLQNLVFGLPDLSFTTQEGISLGVELNVSGFTCMRFGWAAKHLVPAAEQQFIAAD